MPSPPIELIVIESSVTVPEPVAETPLPEVLWTVTPDTVASPWIVITSLEPLVMTGAVPAAASVSLPTESALPWPTSETPGARSTPLV